ncbi:FAD/NAD(P)-binding protein [Pseudoxanthomonas japonensis]|uniref:Pyridine nucleotide-disulfide oxidoreductase n=1 Tax=Pseudoxanthomonas japonensis TaxID=69284 RepID=A0ABQ6ZDE1_9GAMM|nr:FAD/NAD(P)-binding protein [Pseudoxanthomonas japonensis]KAF1723242.1 pyridine nucleotide-disulfide oxidoreductase [Pseudoxanthomonas japonensis]
MTEATPTPLPPCDLAIIGGGAGGVLAAMQALRLATTPLRIVMIEPRDVLAQGVAYATTYGEHVLNVPAARMSAFDDRPADFLDYVVATMPPGGPDRDTLAHAFIERRQYGEYLRTRLQEATAASPASLLVVQDSVSELDARGDGATLHLAAHGPLEAKGVVLAVGNTPKPLPARGAPQLPEGRSLAAWDFDAVKAIPSDAELCIIGSGLSMVDTVLSLADNGHTGAIHVLSRHALLPLPHCHGPAATFDPAPMQSMSLRARMRFLRAAAKQAVADGLPWQAAMERIRPHGQALWQSLSIADQRRFLRHVVRQWDVHRHRIAPEVHAVLQAMLDRGQLRLHRGRLDTVMNEGRRLRVTTHTRDGRTDEFDVDYVVNATGVEMRAQTMRNPLLHDVLGKGHAQPGPHGIGLKAARDGRMVDADGTAQPRVFILGSLRIGCVWESIAIPELRGQAETAVRELLAIPAP